MTFGVLLSLLEFILCVGRLFDYTFPRVSLIVLDAYLGFKESWRTAELPGLTDITKDRTGTSYQQSLLGES